MSAMIDKKVILQLVHQEHGVRSKEFSTTFREVVPVFKQSMLPEGQEKSLVLVLMMENDEGNMEFSNNAMITVAHFIELVEKQNG